MIFSRLWMYTRMWCPLSFFLWLTWLVFSSSWIVDRCFRGDLVKGRTVLLVVRHISILYQVISDWQHLRETHNVALAISVAQHVVSIDQYGTVRSHGVENFANVQTLYSEGEHGLRTVVEEVNPAIKKASPSDGKLVIAEEIAKGRVTWKSMKLYFSGLGGDYPLMFFLIWISVTFLTDWVNTFQVWFLGYWGSKYENHIPSEVDPIP